ncbi:hypothetical protein PUT78_09860 [Roseinatronobacter sp. HJB301]|uniref:CD-NTase-associated protein 12/Pycsar effector protein TIR domain-containing protein n=1 Tax=Roseinatronobacter alkalisoli TaxID=3028235 RepID=A0ABT5T8G1_9RHOB|nr:hypothetical protein [Roseinatronobacter sp. HJB301]
MQVFYSWQTDVDRKINKNFIHDALVAAINEISADIGISEAARAESQITLDQDTQGILGSPSIAETILKKIAAADVVVLDVSLIACGREEKRHINSNVAIELGYALGKRGHEPLLKVMNTHYGDFDKLPFDLRDRRHPVAYCLSPDATKVQIETERKNLSRKLKAILAEYLQNLSSAPVIELNKHEPTSSSFVETAFWPQNAPIAKIYQQDEPMFCESSRLVSIRVIPAHAQDKLTQLQCRNMVKNCPPLLYEDSYSSSVNEWGALTYCKYEGTTSILSGTQILKNREIWMFARGIIFQVTDNGPDNARWFTNDHRLMRYIPDAIENAINLCSELIVGSAEIRLTAADLSGVAVKSGERFHPRNHEISEKVIEIRREIDSSLAPNELAFEFAQKVYAEAGVNLPSG